MTDQIQLPKVLLGHWETQAGYQLALRYSKDTLENMSNGHLSDEEVAEALVLAKVTDLDLIAWQTSAKERIRWLSVQYALEKLKIYKDEQVVNYSGHMDRKDLSMGHLSDFFLANTQFITSRNDAFFIDYKLAASARIKWLSNQIKLIKESTTNESAIF